MFLFLHPFVHWLYGGKGQITRIFKPQWQLPQRQPELVDALIERVQALQIERTSPAPGNPLSGSRRAEPPKTVTIFAPLALAIAAGAALAPLCTAIEEQTQQTLRIVRIDAADAPSIDGDISEAVWRRVPPVVALTQHGANFGGGESTVEVRAVHDGKFAYFAFTWTDPSR